MPPARDIQRSRRHALTSLSPPQLSEISWLFYLAIQNDDKKLSKLVGVRVENWMKMIINFDQSNGNGAC